MELYRQSNQKLRVALIGFGEAATAFVSGWINQVPAVFQAYDIKTEAGEDSKKQMFDTYQAMSVRGYDNVEDAVSSADVIFSLVTADQAEEAAMSVSRSIKQDAFYFDCNSCAPESKKRSSQLMHEAGGRYVDVAIMMPVHPRLNRTPALISGKYSNEALAIMKTLVMDAEKIGDEVGQASSVKLSRSIMIKGLEAITAECLLTARKLGVEQHVIESLEQSHPGFNWKTAAYKMLERMTTHGIRRSAEMEAAVSMIKDLGLPADMSKATARRQNQIGSLQLTAKDKFELADKLIDTITASGFEKL